MELIFDSIEERDEFFTDHCPGRYGFNESRVGYCTSPKNCKKCWEQSGVKYRIKNQPTPDHPVPIEEQDGYCGGFTYLTTDWFDNPLLKRQAQIMMNSIYGAHGDVEPAKRITDQLIRNGYFDKPEDTLLHYIQNDVQATIDLYHMRKAAERDGMNKKPEIKDIIWNGPATIVFWKDGDKTVVKCADCDVMDYEKGLAMAICKKIYGNGYWKNIFKRYLYDDGPMLPEPPEPLSPEGQLKQLTKEFKELVNDMFNVPTSMRTDTPIENPWLLYGQKIIPTDKVVIVKTPKATDPELQKSCDECKYSDTHEFVEPCRSCDFDCSNFESKEEKEEERSCALCKYMHTLISEDPCASCDKPGDRYSKFEKKEKESLRSCLNCKYGQKPVTTACIGCSPLNGLIYFEPKDAK